MSCPDLAGDLAFMFSDNGLTVAATWNGATIWVYYDRPFFLAREEFADIATSKPQATCRTSDVSDAAQGDKITIDGTQYTVDVPMPDGNGVTVLGLMTK